MIERESPFLCYGFTTNAAMRSAFGIQIAATGTPVVHLAGKKLRHPKAAAQDDQQQRQTEERIHGLNFRRNGMRYYDMPEIAVLR
ncbi:MAG: hypothetical protein HYX72_00245 [Acidobacteria bacterium]|nr:hypothetical protein [Acidobacteriota bacterium]